MLLSSRPSWLRDSHAICVQSESGWGEDGRCGMLTFSLTGEPVFGNVATFPTLCLLKSNPKKETYRCISHIVAVYIYTSLWLGTVSLPSCLVVVFCDLLLAEICTTAVLPKTCSPVRDNVNIPHLPSSPQKDSDHRLQRRRRRERRRQRCQVVREACSLLLFRARAVKRRRGEAFLMNFVYRDRHSPNFRPNPQNSTQTPEARGRKSLTSQNSSRHTMYTSRESW